MADIATRVVIDTTTGQASITNLGNVSEREFARIQRQLKDTNALLKAFTANQKEAGAAAQSATSGVDALASSTASAHTGIAGITRELIIMSREAATGNFNRLGGSASVLAGRLGILQGLFSPLGAAIGVTAGAIGAFAYAMVHANEEAENFRKSMMLTGGAAGVTKTQFDEMAQAISTSMQRSSGAVKDDLQAIISFGTVAPRNIQPMTEAMLRYQSATGKTQEEVARAFEEMSRNAADWAKTHKEAAGAVTAAQFQMMQQLHASGDDQGALSILLQGINTNLKDQASWTEKVAHGWSIATDSMKEFFHIGQTEGEGLPALQKQAEELSKQMLQARIAFATPGIHYDSDAPDKYAAALKKVNDQIAEITKKEADARAAAKAAGETAEKTQKGKDAIDRIDALAKEAKSADNLSAALKRLKADRDAAEAAGAKVDPKQYAQAQETLTKRFEDPNARRSQEEFNKYITGTQAEIDKTKQLTLEVGNLGKAQDGAAVAALKSRLATDESLKSWSKPQQQQALGVAAGLDQTTAQYRQAEAEAATRKNIQAYQELNEAKEKSAQAAFVEEALLKEISPELDKNSEAYRRDVAAITALAEARFKDNQAKQDTAAAQKVEEFVEKEIEAINRENDALKQNTLQRMLAADAAKIQAEANKELREHPEDAANIQVRTQAQTAAAAQARTQQYTQSRQAGTGAQQGLTSWVESATDGAAQANKLVTSSLDAITNSLTKFVETGKLSFKDLWKTMADEFLSNIIRMEVANLANSFVSAAGSTGGGGLFGSLFKGIGDLFGGGDSSAGQSAPGYATANIMDFIGGARADGGNVNAGTPYLVGERGPELFKPTGSGNIVPNSEMGAQGGQVIHIGQGQTFNIGQGVSRAEVYSAVQQANTETLRQVQRLSSTGKLRTQ